MVLLALILGLLSLALVVDAWFLQGTYYSALPEFTATACALAGLLIAWLSWSGKKKRRRSAKKRRFDVAAITVDLIAALICSGYWLYTRLMLFK
jgi:hypothetical protein